MARHDREMHLDDHARHTFRVWYSEYRRLRWEAARARADNYWGLSDGYYSNAARLAEVMPHFIEVHAGRRREDRLLRSPVKVYLANKRIAEAMARGEIPF